MGSNRIFSMCRWISGLERCEVAGFSNIEKEPQRCKEAKLHDAQTSRSISHLEHLLRKMQDYRALKPPTLAAPPTRRFRRR